MASIELKEKVHPKGHLRVILEEPGKDPEERDLGENLVVNGGMNLLALLLAGNLSGRIQFADIGTGATPAAKTDSGLQLAFNTTILTFTLIASGVTCTAVYLAGGVSSTQACTEFGCFTNNIMYNRIVFAPINIALSTQVTFKLDLTFD